MKNPGERLERLANVVWLFAARRGIQRGRYTLCSFVFVLPGFGAKQLQYGRGPPGLYSNSRIRIRFSLITMRVVVEIAVEAFLLV